jgi:hypothetical protein
LQKKRVNPKIIDVMENWFHIGSACVKWINVLSDPVILTAGVRQGGILSPLLFSAYIDILLIELEKSKLGCFINGKCFNSFLYADDLLLMSISITDLQTMTNKCVEILNSLDLQINAEKTCCLRIGKRYQSACKEISIDGCLVRWVREAKYLGVVLKSGVKFSCNWQSAKSHFFSSVNCILGSLGSTPPIHVSLTLFRLNCIPILTYGLASLSLSSAELHSLSFAYNNIFSKLFKANNKRLIEQCQYYCNFWPLYALIDYLRFTFLASCLKKDICIVNNVFDQSDIDDLYSIASKYNLNVCDSKSCVKFKIWKFLEHSLL